MSRRRSLDSTDTRPRRRARPRPRVRMSADARREQLLDSAAQLIVEKGWDGLTMEAVGQQAGASKTLGYAYFENIEDVIWSLYMREVGALTQFLRSAIEAVEGFDRRLRAAVHAYLDQMVERGPLLNALAAGVDSGRIGPHEDPYEDSVTLIAGMLNSELSLGKARARAYAIVLGTTAYAHAELLLAGRRSRKQVEADCVAFFLAGIAAVRS